MSSRSCSQSAIGSILLAAVLLLVPSLGAQQTGTITGRVTDAQSGEPIPSVQLYISGLDLGVLTQQNGRYLLQNVPPGTHTLTGERIGYRIATVEVSVGAGETVVQNFTLSEEALQLNEVIVTGTPGGTQRRALGNSVTTIDAAVITQGPTPTNAQDLFEGRTPGLQFVRRTGNVGSGSPIRIRGVGSFNLNSNPLIYIDGVRANNTSSAGPAVEDGGPATLDASGDGTVNVLDDFNPEDIESIEIIKGPAAATLYGTEASAGVIQIITKKGAEGDAQISFSVRQGANYMPDPAGKLGQQWGCRSQVSTPCPEEDLFAYNMYDEANKYISGEVLGPDGTNFFDWPGDQLYQYGHVQGYNADIRGGTQTVRYFASGNYEKEKGVEWYNWDETYRFRANLSVVPSENWTADLSAGYVLGNTRFAQPVLNQGGPWQDMRWSNGFCLLRINPGECPRLGGFQEHLPDDVAKVPATRDYNRFTGGLTLTHRAGDWFTQRAVVGIDKGWDVNQVYFPTETVRSPVYAESAEGEIKYANPASTNLTMEYSATVDLDWTEVWNFQTSVGGQFYTKKLEELSNVGRNFASPAARTVNLTSIEQASIDYRYIENKSVGFYVQEQVGWNDRAFVTAAIRFDDNSAFGTDFEALTYPKFSATWVVSEESFWPLDAVNSFRLRGAWGKAGRQPDVFAARNVWGVMAGVGGTAALVPVSPGNPEVGPEVSSEIELGFDVALLDDRISGEFTYFRQSNRDALLNKPLPPNLGFPGSVQQNVGRIDNWGWEATLNSQVYAGENWSFDLALNADHTDNEIKSLGDFPGDANIRAGFPYPNHTTQYWVLTAEFDDAGNFTNAMCDSGVGEPGAAQFPGGTPVPCGEISGDQRILIGPGFYTYRWGVAPTLYLFGNALQVFALAEGSYGRTGQENALEWGHIYNNTRVSQLENDPVWVASDRGNFQDDRSKEYYDGDFWKLREVGFRYRLPDSLAGRIGAERASFSASARNTWTIWQRQDEVYGGKISDPESGSVEDFAGGGNFRLMPPIANVSATLRVTF